MDMKTKTEILALSTVNDPRWAAVVARDSRADGTFVYSVRTTGVYCRPSCAARRARPENVDFHASAADAQRASFRAPALQAGRAFARGAAHRLVAELCQMLRNLRAAAEP
jgi:AraC family transcriptional regulator of adaptative response/methylated-DNA-[protein]-cysteine methyltransferase